MKVLITALALVTLIASPTSAQRQYPGEFYPASYQSPANSSFAAPAFTQSAAAARKAGFGETSSFTTAFRKVTGVTPTAYHRSLA